MYYIVTFNGERLASEELFNTAVAGGERSFIKMLARKEVLAQTLLDQVLYPLTDRQEAQCRAYSPLDQDFDDFYGSLNLLSKTALSEIKEGRCDWLPDARVITLGPTVTLDFYIYKKVVFLRSVDYKAHNKSHMLPKMAAFKLCGRVYIAINAVDVRIESPIIVTI